MRAPRHPGCLHQIRVNSLESRHCIEARRERQARLGGSGNRLLAGLSRSTGLKLAHRRCQAQCERRLWPDMQRFVRVGAQQVDTRAQVGRDVARFLGRERAQPTRHIPGQGNMCFFTTTSRVKGMRQGSHSCPIFRQPCCRLIGRSQSTPPSHSLAGQSSAHSTLREPEVQIEPRVAPGGGRGGQQRRFARGIRCGHRKSGSGPTRGCGWRRSRRLQRVDSLRNRRLVSRRCG